MVLRRAERAQPLSMVPFTSQRAHGCRTRPSLSNIEEPSHHSPRTKLLILSSYHGTGRHIIHIIRVGFVFRSSLGDTYMDQPRAQSTILNH